MRDQFEIVSAEAVTIKALRRAMLDYEPQIVHFSGHGAGEQGLVLVDDAGRAKLVPSEALVSLFTLFEDQVECVLLNACYSEVQAQAITQHIDYVIGMKEAIGDTAAHKFAVGFYDGLGAGRSIEVSYELGCNAIVMEGIREDLTPVLKQKTTSSNQSRSKSIASSLVGSQPVPTLLPQATSVAASEPVEVFFSYSHRDEVLRDKLADHLTILKRRGVIKAWHDREISGGQEWAGEIDQAMNAAQIILLLVSDDFLASDYCYDIEMRRAMERHETGKARVVPIILRPVDWSGAPFGKLQALPKNAKPVTTWDNRDEAFLNIAQGIQKTVQAIRSPQESVEVTRQLVAFESSAEPPPTSSTLESEKRYLNAGIKDRDRKEPLVIEETYLLEFRVDTDKGTFFATDMPDNQVLFKDDETSIDLTIQLDGDDFDVMPRMQTLKLPRYGASKKVNFMITPKQEGSSMLTATVHKQGNFVLEMELTFPIGTEDTNGATTSVHGRLISAAQYLKPRELGLRFKKVEDGYECIIWGAVSNQVILPLNSVEIKALIDRARAAMMDVVMYTDANNKKIFQTSINIDTTSSVAALKTLAFAGSELFQGLFYGPQAGPDVMNLGDYLKKIAMKDTPVKLQIVAENFPVPWALLYFGETRSGAELDWNKFLGMRHIIEQIPRQATMLVDDCEIMSNNPSLSVSLNVNTSIDAQMKFDAVARQVKDWEQRSASSKGVMVLTQRQTKTDLLAALSSLSNDQLMYFYCHATTVKPADSSDPWSSFIELTNRERVTLADLNREAPMREALPGNPLIFLNACESAEISPEFYDGFVPYFMAKGARGVVGTECKTPALFATEWALQFFPRFLGGAPLGELFLELRQEFCKQHGNPLGLFYTVYCNGDTYVKPGLN